MGKKAEVDQVRRDLVTANHILANEGVVDGFGHVSARHPHNPEHFLISRSLAPAMVAKDDILELDFAGDTVDGSGKKSYLERFIHSEIYRVRPDVMAVIHSHSPSVVPFTLSRTPMRAVTQVGAFMGTAIPMFEIRDVAGDETDLLIRTRELGVELAKRIGPSNIILMRGHGMVVTGTSIKETVYHAVVAESNARLQSEAIALGTELTYLTEGEARAATATQISTIDRPWDLWRRKLASR